MITKQFNTWIKSGVPYVWLNAGAVTVSILLVVGLLVLIAIRGLGHFWPGRIAEFDLTQADGTSKHMIGEVMEVESVPRTRLSDERAPADVNIIDRYLIKIGNRDYFGLDFSWVLGAGMSDIQYPAEVMAVERREWGNFYGYLLSVREGDRIIQGDVDQWGIFQKYINDAITVYDEIRYIEKDLIGAVNYKMERLRLRERGLELNGITRGPEIEEIKDERQELQSEYGGLTSRLDDLYKKLNEASFTARLSDGREEEIPIAKVVRAYRPNTMSTFQKIGFYSTKLWEFMSTEPREANTEGGIFPAIFGTVLMVMIMAVLVTPFGVVAAIYLREYARQGIMTRLIRIAVNNLAGVPSVVYGVFGLGFFVYFIGGNIDELLFRESLPAPTFGTPGLLWASLTLALLTVPVVIVATEEGLSRVPRAIREGSLALGATKAETMLRTVLPMTASAMITGLILAIARAAGEVAPLMLVGVVKLAPSLPLDGNYPYLHMDRKFMHLGFHIYDVGFQSPNVEAARPLVYATALLLVLIIILLNLAAIHVRNNLREKYRAAE